MVERLQGCRECAVAGPLMAPLQPTMTRARLHVPLPLLAASAVGPGEGRRRGVPHLIGVPTDPD